MGLVKRKLFKEFQVKGFGNTIKTTFKVRINTKRQKTLLFMRKRKLLT